MSAIQETWFGDEAGRNDEEDAFLARLRLMTSTWHYPDIAQNDSSVFTGLTPLMLELEIPRLPFPTRFLRVYYWTSGARPVGLDGWWEEGDRIEGPNGRDFENLTVAGVDASPEQYAAWVAAWFTAQLARPIVRQEWLRDGEVAATIWRLPETGRILRRTGHFWLGRWGTEPDRTTRIR